MKLQHLIEFFLFFIGFVIGFSIHSMLFTLNAQKFAEVQKFFSQIKSNDKIKVFEATSEKFDSSLAEKVTDEVRVFCWVITHGANHKVRVPHVSLHFFDFL